MKIAIIGAGAVGGYYGARLAQAGHDVVFIEHGPHGAAMRRDGLRIESDLGAAHVQDLQVADDPAQVGPVDLVVIAVKLWDTEAAVRAAVPMVGPSTSVLSLQNGIDKNDLIASAVGAGHVVGALTYISVVISAPGTVTQTGKAQKIVVGELAGPLTPRIEAIAAAFRSAGVETEASPDIQRALWEKFVSLAAFSAVTAATRLPLGPLRENPATRALLLDAMREGLALARAEGIDMRPDFEQGFETFIDQVLPANARASMAQDLARGHRLELDWLSGTILRRAERHRLPTPTHRTLYATLCLYAGGPPAA